MSGLDGVKALADGSLPAPPVARLRGMETTHAEAGLVRMVLLPAEFHYNPLGTVHGGVIATLLESALAAAVRSTLPAGRMCITVEIKVSYIRAITASSGAVTGEGRVVHAGRQVAFAEGRIADAGGKLFATASSICLIQDAPAADLSPRAEPLPAERSREIEWSDPLVGARAAAGLNGLEALRRGARPPISVLVGMEVGAIEPGTVRMDLPPGEHLCGQQGIVHGGMLAVLLDSVMGCAIHTTLPAGSGYTTLEIKLSFLHAVTAASGLVSATGLAVHSGARTATAEARAVDSAGRLCATGTTTCLVFARPLSA